VKIKIGGFWIHEYKTINWEAKLYKKTKF